MSCFLNFDQVRPVSKRSDAGFLQVGVETYGGGVWHSWFDRDLSLAGRVVLGNSDSGFVSKLVRIERPILRIPTLAIHCERLIYLLTLLVRILIINALVDGEANVAFKFNKETEFVPILGLVEQQLNSPPEDKDKKKNSTEAYEHHHAAVLALLAEELSIAAEEIQNFEL